MLSYVVEFLEAVINALFSFPFIKYGLGFPSDPFTDMPGCKEIPKNWWFFSRSLCNVLIFPKFVLSIVKSLYLSMRDSSIQRASSGMFSFA